MAFSRTPTQDTYSAQRVSLFREIALRDGGASGKDENYVNVFFEGVAQSKMGDQRRFLMKRSGTSLAIPSVAASNVRGMHFWSDLNKLVYCVGRNVYVYNFNTSSSTTLSNVFATSTGPVGFTEFLYDNGTTKMVGSDGSAVSGIITIDSTNTVVTSSDVNLPQHDPNIVYLDGYLFLVQVNSGFILNSDLNNPLSYIDPTTGQAIVPELEPDQVVRLAKVNNYLVAFGTNSIEYFWDAANASPDSPMQRNDSPVKINTYLAGFAQYGNTIYYVGVDYNGQPDVFMLKDFKIEAVGNASISRYLSTVFDDVSTWYGAVVSFQGHVFYVVNAGNNMTWAIDLRTGFVFKLAFQQNATFNLLLSTNMFNTANTRTFFVLNNGTSNIYRFDENVFQDVGTDFTCVVITENNDFGTLNRKTMGRFALYADRPSSNTNMLVQWSDDDYQTYNTGVSLNLNQDIPAVRQLGTFRQRAFKLTYTGNYPLRLQDIEVNINKGTA